MPLAHTHPSSVAIKTPVFAAWQSASSRRSERAGWPCYEAPPPSVYMSLKGSVQTDPLPNQRSASHLETHQTLIVERQDDDDDDDVTSRKTNPGVAASTGVPRSADPTWRSNESSLHQASPSRQSQSPAAPPSATWPITAQQKENQWSK